MVKLNDAVNEKFVPIVKNNKIKHFDIFWVKNLEFIYASFI